MLNKSKLVRIIVVIAFLSLSISFLSFTQTEAFYEKWRWVLFTTKEGLPSDRVTDIVETKGGTIWAVTYSGLAWFDGYKWNPIEVKNGLPAALPKMVIPDTGDGIFVLIDGYLYYGGKGGFQHISLPINGKIKPLSGIGWFPQKGLLLVSDGMLYIYRNNSIIPFELPLELSTQKIRSVITKQSNSVWFNMDKGLYRWENGTWSLVLKAGLRPIGVKLFAENIGGNVLMFLNAPYDYFGIWEWSKGRAPKLFDRLGGVNVLTLDVGPNGDAMVVKESNECIFRRNGIWQQLIKPPLPFYNIIFLRIRDNGDLWVGTENGLYLYKATSRLWSKWKFPQPDMRNNINEILYVKDGSVWLGTASGLVIHRPNNKVETIRKIFGSDIGIVTGLAEDNEGNIWISSGSAFEGAYRWNGTTWRYFGTRDGLDAGFIHKIRLDKKGKLWFLGLEREDFESRNVEWEPGAYVYSNGSFTQWGVNRGLINGRVYSFAEASEGTLWFGTNGGLSQWKPRFTDDSIGVWKHWTVKNGLRSDRVFTLLIDKENRVWFGDQANGLGFIDRDTVKYLTTKEGLVSNSVWDLKLCDKGHIWIATRGGFSNYNNENFTNYSLEEGLENTRIWPILPIKDKIYIGTLGGGVEILNIGEISKEFPRVIPYQPVIKGNTLYTYVDVFAFWGEQSPRDIEIRHRIDNAEWSPWHRERQIIVTGISPGNHTLHFQSKNLFGDVDLVGSKVDFYVEPPLYQQPIFYIPFGFLSVGLMFLAFLYLSRKRKSETIIRKSEARYRNLFEMANDAILIFEPTSEIILEANNRACEIYGFTREEFVKMSLKSITKDVEKGEKQIIKILRDKRTNIFETIHYTKNKSELHILSSATVIEYEGREAILSINKDVTELKKIEEALRNRAQQQALVLKSLPMVFYTSEASPDIRTKWISEQVEDITGYSPQQYTEDPKFWEKRIHPDDRDKVLEDYIKVLETGHSQVEYRWLCSNNSYRWFSDQVVLIRDDMGNPKEVIGMWLDITERKDAEAEIKLLAQTVASVQDFITITDLQNNILFVNDAFINAYGYTQEELYGKNISIILPTESAKDIEAKVLKETLKGGWNGEVLQKRKDGSTFITELWTSVVRNEDDIPVALVGVARDITERKRLEEERENLIKELKETLNEIKTLSGLLPICSVCKKIRDDKGYWAEVESYIMKHSDATFTHSICPDCIKKYYPGLANKIRNQ